LATCIKKIEFTHSKSNQRKIVKYLKEWFKIRKKLLRLDVLQRWTRSFQKSHWMKQTQDTNLLYQRKKNLNLKKKRTKEKKQKNLENRINRINSITLQLMEKRKNKRETNSVGAETKIMESTKMTKIIISQKKISKAKRKVKRIRMLLREMTKVVKMIKEMMIKNKNKIRKTENNSNKT